MMEGELIHLVHEDPSIGWFGITHGQLNGLSPLLWFPKLKAVIQTSERQSDDCDRQEDAGVVWQSC